MKRFNIKDFKSNEETPLCLYDGASVHLEHYYYNTDDEYKITISYVSDNESKWLDLMNEDGLCKISGEYIYFKPTQKTGWMNIYRHGEAMYIGYIYPTKEDSLKELQNNNSKSIDTIKVEWEE